MENNDNLNEENQPLDGGDLNNRGRIIPVNIEAIALHVGALSCAMALIIFTHSERFSGRRNRSSTA